MTTLITDREARALREDALSALGDVAVRRLRPQPARVHSPLRQKMRYQPGARRTRCRACNSMIDDRAAVIEFRLRAKGRWEDGVAYIHEECP